MGCCLFLIPLIGTVPPVPRVTEKSSPAIQPHDGPPWSFQSRLRGYGAWYAAGRYHDAVEGFGSLASDALAARDYDMAARATGDVGGCLFALHQYQAAVSAFLEARRLAESIGDHSEMAVLDANIASLYSEMGELDAAVRWMAGSLQRLSGTDRDHIPKLLIQMGVLRARQGRMGEALASFRQGIAGADRAGDLDLYALGYNRLGEALLLAGDLAGAEPALLEAYRVRKLHHLPLDSSYRSLGRLRLAQGDLNSASHLLDRAVELAARPQGLMPTWDIYHSRGRVRLAQGRVAEALGDLRTAVRLASAWRWSAPCSDAVRVGAESLLDQVYTARIDAGNRLYAQTHDPALIRETFEAVEENRAASLRFMLAGNRQAAVLPPAYWEAVARLQRAEVAALRSPAPGAQEAVAGARAELDRFEAAALPAAPPPTEKLLARAQAALRPDTALFSFQLGESASWLWAVDRSGLALFRLAPRAALEAQVEAFAKALREDTPESAAAGRRLFDSLFGQIPPRFAQRSRWILVLDKSLFGVPVAALPDNTGGQPGYVVEGHITEMIPGVGLWVESAAKARGVPASGGFLGIGDPIYNAADPRLPGADQLLSQPKAMPVSLLVAPPPSPDQISLPRLVGSGAELDACARAWGGEALLLKGADASRRNLLEQLRRHPSVVHFATHFLESEENSSYGLIALSLAGSGETEIISPVDISHWRVEADLVTLSGCRSAAGAVLPGAGLMGLTRAWLMAGARAVVASRWAMPDESGALFTELYHNLRTERRPDPARALAAAQLEMIRFGGWRARPRYWGAFFVVGNE